MSDDSDDTSISEDNAKKANSSVDSSEDKDVYAAADSNYDSSDSESDINAANTSVDSSEDEDSYAAANDSNYSGDSEGNVYAAITSVDSSNNISIDDDIETSHASQDHQDVEAFYDDIIRSKSYTNDDDFKSF